MVVFSRSMVAPRQICPGLGPMLPGRRDGILFPTTAVLLADLPRRKCTSYTVILVAKFAAIATSSTGSCL